MMKLPTYPARPVNGGPLDRAQPKHGLWYYEPKFNGWRTLVHVPTGTMFNRHGELLSISSEFAPALKQLETVWLDNGCDARPVPFPEWVDCEALERRHLIGRGTLIVLDLPLHPGTYEERSTALSSFFEPLNALGFAPCDDNEVRRVSHVTSNVGLKDRTCYTLPEYWQQLQSENRRLGCEFYEGLVAKRADSLYPQQLRSSKQEFPFWMKHRWAF